MAIGIIDGTDQPLVPGTDWIFRLVIPDGTQVIHLSGATGGTFDATYKGQKASAIPYNASLDVLRSRFEALSTIRPGNIAVTGSSGAWVLTPQNQLDAGDFLDNPILFNGDNLTPLASVTFSIEQPPQDISIYEFGFQARMTPGIEDMDNDIVLTETDDPTVGKIVNGESNGELTLFVYAVKTEALDWSDAAQRDTAACNLVGYDGNYTEPFAEGRLYLDPKIYIPGGPP